CCLGRQPHQCSGGMKTLLHTHTHTHTHTHRQTDRQAGRREKGEMHSGLKGLFESNLSFGGPACKSLVFIVHVVRAVMCQGAYFTVHLLCDHVSCSITVKRMHN